MFADTIRQLESVASADLVPQETVDVLTTPIESIASAPITCRWSRRKPWCQAEEFAEDRAAVSAIWNATMAARSR